jgi:hypothetical protein
MRLAYSMKAMRNVLLSFSSVFGTFVIKKLEDE